MKILDEKGRLFGKINIIDLLVLVAVVAVVIFAAVRMRGGEAADDPGEELNVTPITYKVLIRGVEPALYEQVKLYVDPEQDLKDQMMAGITLVENGYVIDCVATPHINYVEKDGRMEAVPSSGEDKRVDLLFTLQATVISTVFNDVMGQQIRVGAYNTVKTTHFEFQAGIIQEFEYK